MVNTTFRVAAATLTLLVPLAAQAQRGGGPRMNRMGAGNPVAPLIDMRRELNLTGRQLVQLESIERGLLEPNQVVRQQLRSRLDSLRPRNRASSEEEIAAYRAEGDSMRALRRVIVRNDSTARAAAMSVLTDSQRVRVRERTAERRGLRLGVEVGCVGNVASGAIACVRVCAARMAGSARTDVVCARPERGRRSTGMADR